MSDQKSAGLMKKKCKPPDAEDVIRGLARENLKLRLLNARLALLAHDQWTFRNELGQAQVWVDRYFDGREKSVYAAHATLKQLSATEINIELPSLNESLSAIKNFKLGKERK